MAPRAIAVVLALAAVACGGRARAPTPDSTSLDGIAEALDAMSHGLTAAHRATFRSILEDTLAKDAYTCMPSPHDVFFGDAPDGERTIRGVMPHYGFFLGPMQYRVRRQGSQSHVRVKIALEPPVGAASLELPDCELARELLGDAASCTGTPYSQAPGKEACPRSGSFSVPATPENVRAMLAQWSRDVERYWNRDATLFGLPVSYDFEFVLAAEAEPPVDLAVPLAPTCGRTPYMTSFRSGWSLPIVAHETGHVMGLLDEYEAFSGILASYPKTPFAGADVSRMGLSMREGTRVLPLHHYLILRRARCPEPKARGFYEGAFPK